MMFQVTLCDTNTPDVRNFDIAASTEESAVAIARQQLGGRWLLLAAWEIKHPERIRGHKPTQDELFAA